VCVCYCGWVVTGAVVIRYKLPILRAQHTDKQTTLCVTHVGMGRIHTPHVGNVAPKKQKKSLAIICSLELSPDQEFPLRVQTKMH